MQSVHGLHFIFQNTVVQAQHSSRSLPCNSPCSQFESRRITERVCHELRRVPVSLRSICLLCKTAHLLDLRCTQLEVDGFQVFVEILVFQRAYVQLCSSGETTTVFTDLHFLRTGNGYHVFTLCQQPRDAHLTCGCAVLLPDHGQIVHDFEDIREILLREPRYYPPEIVFGKVFMPPLHKMVNA